MFLPRPLIIVERLPLTIELGMAALLIANALGVPPKAMTIGNVTGSSHTAGGPSCAPQSPTAISTAIVSGYRGWRTRPPCRRNRR